MSKAYKPTRILSYVVASDNGLAPNITGGICTLAVCKPIVRKIACIGKDWIIGMSTTLHGSNKVIYAAQVDEKIPYAEFFKDPRFDCKKPDTDVRGDNFFRMVNGKYRLEFNNAAHAGNTEKIARDLKTPFAIVGQRFWYFGENAPELPPKLSATKLSVPGTGGRRGHRVTSDPETIQGFVAWIKQFKPGINGGHRDPMQKL